jgi:hypothetical protein
VHAIIESEEQSNVVVSQIDIALAELKVIQDWIRHYTNLLDVRLSAFCHDSNDNPND